MNKSTKVPSLRKLQWLLFLMGLFKIPLIGFVRPKLLSIDTEKLRVKIRLRRRSKNHLNSMYFGALAVGADIAGGLHVFYFAEMESKKVSFSFKGMKAEFLKRAETDVVFESNQGKEIERAMNESSISGERVNTEVMVKAYDDKGEVVATFAMIASLKVTK